MPFTRFKRASNQKNATNATTDSDHQTTSKRIAIIGSGVSGLTCAHYLGTQHDVTIFEANDYIGGHVNTIDVALQDGKKAKSSNVESSAIDTGFIVFNEKTYPNLIKFLLIIRVYYNVINHTFII